MTEEDKNFSLEGKTALVTGGSRGIGYAIAEGIIDAGGRVIISARNSKVLEDAAINKLRKQQPESTELEDLNEEQEDSFDKIYKGEVSKSGAEILPSKRMRRTPEKMNLNNESTDVVKKDKLNDKVADSKKTDEKMSLSENEKSEE